MHNYTIINYGIINLTSPICEAIIRLRRNLGACKFFAGAKMHMHNYTIINYGIINKQKKQKIGV